LTRGRAGCDVDSLVFRGRRRFAVTISHWLVHAILLGFAGRPRVCVVENQRVEFEREALDLRAAIARSNDD
jgi:hypothetical protein